MKAHIVVAHPEPKSVNGTLARASAKTLANMGWETSFSDLYQMGFDPCDRPEQYQSLSNPEAFHVQTEQRFHANNDTTPPEVAAEVKNMLEADLLIVHFPLWWFGMPAMLKGWMDRVFVYGSVYKSTMRHDTGRLQGKKMLACVTTGASAEGCSHSGMDGDTRMHLWPILYPFKYIGFEVLKPEIFHGIGGATFLEGKDQGLTGLDALTEQWRTSVENINARASIKYNKDTDFDAAKKLIKSAPEHSPFIAHKSKI